MIVRVKLFAVARQRVAQDEVQIDVPAAAPTVADLRVALQQRFPALAEVLPHVKVAVNNDYAADTSKLVAGAEVALIPPVSGG